MLVGEAFNATHLALPHQLHNAKMLHSWLDWTETQTQKQTVEDFRRIGEIRSQHRDLFHNNIHETKLIDVPAIATPTEKAKPYVRFLPGEKAAVVVGNSNEKDAITVTLQMPLGAMGMDSFSGFYVTDCWTGTATKTTKAALDSYAVTVPPDKSAGGGVWVLIIETQQPVR